MTVIATIITSHFTAHGTDSFVTRPNADGTYELLESQDTKIVRVPRWRGAISYWGLASDNAGWSTLKWLCDRAAKAERYASAEEFARSIAADLTSELSARRFRAPLHRGIGVHFTAYERIDDYWIPELFHIRNWVTPDYDAVDPAGVSVTRETYGAVRDTKGLDEHRKRSYRLAVHRALQSDRMLVSIMGIRGFSIQSQTAYLRLLRNSIAVGYCVVRLMPRRIWRLYDGQLKLSHGSSEILRGRI
jgi:hypothetical protein